MIFVPYIIVVMTVLFVSKQGGQCEVTMFAMFVSEQGEQGEVAMFVKFIDEHGGQGGFTSWSHDRLVTETLVIRLGATVTLISQLQVKYDLIGGGDLQWFLEIEILQNREEKLIWLSQS